MMIQNPLGVDVMCDVLACNGALEQPLPSQMIEQRRIHRRLLSKGHIGETEDQK
jgi:hypothetical protein